MTLIKICGVKSEEEALITANAGADYIGIVLHSGSKRFIKPKNAASIAKAIRQGGATPVAVFLNESRDEILEATEIAGINTVQIYCDIVLPEDYTVMYANVQSKRVNGSNNMYLFDGPNPGSGQPLQPEYLPNVLPQKFFIAGGITPDNVRSFLETYHPTGVDVASGVETNGDKDLNKIQTFIKQVRDYDKNIR